MHPHLSEPLSVNKNIRISEMRRKYFTDVLIVWRCFWLFTDNRRFGELRMHSVMFLFIHLKSRKESWCRLGVCSECSEFSQNGSIRGL